MLKLLLALLMGVQTGESQGKDIMGERKKQVQTFLKNISKVESSGGKNFNHPEIQDGMHKGHKAIGRYGLMPNTVYEVVNRMRMNGTADPEILKLKQLNAEQLKEHLENNPSIEDKIAESLATRVLDRQQDEDKAAYSWFEGHNLSSNDIADKYKDSNYVKKYNQYKNSEDFDE